MRSMVAYTKAAVERAMQVQEVILRAMAKRITWWQAAEIIGISDSFRCGVGVERYEQHGIRRFCSGTRRRGAPSGRAPSAGPGGAGAGPYRERYCDLNVRPFPREAGRGARRPSELYLGQAGAAGRGAGVARRRKRGVHRLLPAAAAGAGDAAAHRRQPAPVVSGRALA